MKLTLTALLASATTSVFAIPTPTEQGPITARQAASACATAVRTMDLTDGFARLTNDTRSLYLATLL